MSHTSNQNLQQLYHVESTKRKSVSVSRQLILSCLTIALLIGWVLTSFLNDGLYLKEASASSLILICIIILRLQSDPQ